MLRHRGESTSKPARALSEGASSPGRTAASFAVLVGRAVPAAGATGAILGGAYLAAWWSGAASRWSAAGVITMKTNMALSLVLAGGALLLLGTDEAAPKHRGAVTVGALVALLVGLLTLGEHLFRYDLGIDQLLAREAPGAAATASPNRMGLPGSACLALLGAGLVAAAWNRRIAPYFGLATCLIVLVPAIGFVYGIGPFYQAPGTGIAWPTVIALFSLGLGLMLTHGERGPLAVLWRNDPGGVLLRRLLVPAVLAPLVVGYFRVQGERHGLYDGPTGTGLFALTLVLLLSALLWRSAEQLSASAAQRERATDEVAAGKERLATTLRSIGDAVVATDGAGRVTVFNGVAEKLTGWRADEALGRPLVEVFHIIDEDSREPVSSPVERVLREGIVVGLANHTALVARDGTERPIADSGAPIRDAQGNISGVVLVFRDQTAERRAEDAQARLAAIVESTDDAILSKDLHGKILTWNAAAERLLGYRADEVVGQSIEAIIPAERRDEEKDILSRVEAGERVVHFETQRVTKRGDAVDVSITVSPLRDHDGRIIGASKILRDITAQKRASEALRQSERRLRALADSMPQLAWAAQPDGYISWYNRRWFEYTGTTPEQMEGWGWQSVHDPATLPDVLRRWTESITSGSAFEMEFPLRGADGNFRRFLTRVVPLKDQDGKVLQWFGTNTDVTELVEAREALREANRLKDDFLSMASHELRTPLTALRLQAETLARSMRKTQAADERVERKLSVMEAQCDRLDGLVHTLLDVSRITAGKIVLDLAQCDLAELVREVLERFELQAERAGVEFRVRTREVVGRWDRARIDQAVTNLVGNAIKYGNGQPVEVAVDEHDGVAVLAVRDHGVGISPESHARIFERFERAANTRAASGLGLGLWIAKQMVEAHGGDIAVESAPGAGATFTVTLPRSVQ